MGTQKKDWRDCEDATQKNNDNSGSSSSSTSTTITSSSVAGCDGWSNSLDARLAALDVDLTLLNNQTDKLNAMYDDAITNEEIDKYNALVDKQNAAIAEHDAKRIPLDIEVERWNAECAT